MGVNRENIEEHLMEYQLNMIGKTLNDLRENDMSFVSWSITKEQYEQLKKYSIKTIKKVFKCNTRKAVGIFEWFYKIFGLKIKT